MRSPDKSLISNLSKTLYVNLQKKLKTETPSPAQVFEYLDKKIDKKHEFTIGECELASKDGVVSVDSFCKIIESKHLAQRIRVVNAYRRILVAKDPVEIGELCA